MTVEYPLAVDPADLPSVDSPTVKLLPASEKDTRKASILNGQAWRGPLSMEDYLSREKHLCSQTLSRDGGFTAWVLVDSARPESERTVLAACETIRKRALVRDREGVVRDVVTHGIGSVFCREEYRGRGYAQKMIQDLRDVLENWQQKEGEKASFNVLYSDIGKEFYAKLGWLPYASMHITLRPLSSRTLPLDLPPVEPVLDKHIDELCRADEDILRRFLSAPAAHGRKIMMIQAPEAHVMRWHHAREEFLAERLQLGVPDIKGVCVRMPDQKRVWAIWTRTFQQDPSENTLHILRLVVEDAEPHTTVSELNGNASSLDVEITRAIAACLDAAQKEAAAWGMNQVDLWNPAPVAIAAARMCEPGTKLRDREQSSIPSLLWYGPAQQEEVEWICNEKYAWC